MSQENVEVKTKRRFHANERNMGRTQGIDGSDRIT
jgi:hypothetical protein